MRYTGVTQMPLLDLDADGLECLAAILYAIAREARARAQLLAADQRRRLRAQERAAAFDGLATLVGAYERTMERRAAIQTAARVAGAPVETVERACRDADRRAVRKGMLQRDLAIVHARLCQVPPVPVAELARRYGISRGRVSQIVRKHSIVR